MSHRQKVDHLIADLHDRGVGKYTTAPPLFRLLWSLGVEVPPPFFLGFGALFLLMGSFFGVAYGGVMGVLVSWQVLTWSVELTVVCTAVAGVVFGLYMARYYRDQARRLGLPSWDAYPEVAASRGAP